MFDIDGVYWEEGEYDDRVVWVGEDPLGDERCVSIW